MAEMQASAIAMTMLHNASHTIKKLAEGTLSFSQLFYAYMSYTFYDSLACISGSHSRSFQFGHIVAPPYHRHALIIKTDWQPQMEGIGEMVWVPYISHEDRLAKHTIDDVGAL